MDELKTWLLMQVLFQSRHGGEEKTKIPTC
jgi:hypothetical protein